MSNQRFVTFASVISEIQQSDIFMTVKARILETPKANLNGARVTEAFVDDIIENKERYIGLPLYADKRALDNGKYDRLGHLFDSRTGEFHSTQIGSFYDFEKETFKGGSYLVGYARIPKRDAKLSKAIAELFADGKLKFSFEIACGEYEELDDGTFQIDAAENNYLEGTAIVTFPACEDAVALEFVAQREADVTERGDEEMAEEEKVVAEEAVEVNTEVSETTPQTVEAEIAEVTEPVEQAAEATENAACNEKKDENACGAKKENADVYVTESHTERFDTSMYDTETGRDAYQSIEVHTSVTDRVDGNIVDTDDGVAVAEDADGETPAENVVEETHVEETPVENKEEVPAEEVVVEVPDEAKKLAETLASVVEAVKNLTAEIQEMKEVQKKHESASIRVTAENINPFMGDMSANGSKYDLLEKESQTKSYSLLSK